MTLYFVGLGIANIKDLSFKGLDLIKKSDIIYLESYTSLYESDLEEIENFIGKKIEIAKRSDLEENCRKIIELAKNNNVCILVFGEPFFATTHVVLKNEAIKNGIKVEVAHSSSILCSIFSFGVSSYKIGKIVTIPLKSKINVPPKSIYETIKQNKERKLHTVCLLDLDLEKKELLKPKDALEFLLQIENEFKENVIKEEDLILIASRVGYENEEVYFGNIKKLKNVDVDIPAIIVLLSELSSVERESLELSSKKFF